MNWKVENREDKDFVKVATSGNFTIEDHEKMITDIVSRDFWTPGKDVFFDNRDLNFGQTSVEIMKRASENHQRYDKSIGNGKTAILMKSLVDFGRGRQFELLSSDNVSARLRIFMDEQDALNWLAEK